MTVPTPGQPAQGGSPPGRTPGERSVLVDLGPRSYHVVIGHGTLASLGPRLRTLFPDARRAFVVLDDAPPLLASSPVNAAIASLRHASFDTVRALAHADERRKSIDALGLLLAAMTASRLERREPLVVIGGGLVGDLAGFAAASYRRGVPWVQCPTTLLAAVDASVGGKTAINIETAAGLAKNMAGAFHQPSLVLADLDTLSTLPPRELRCGLAECLKHAMLGGLFDEPGLLDWTLAHTDAFHALDRNALQELVARNVAIKARVVAGDEREEARDDAGGRALLNLGHTFAHAIETLPGVSPDDDPSHAPLKHGEAVALGLVAAVHTASAMGLCSSRYASEIRNAVVRLGLPASVRGLPGTPAIVARMKDDKKVSYNTLRLILPGDDRRASVRADVPPAAIESGLGAIVRD
ncbi:MAG: 3-dehydroquinate synthase [Phycisphaeraceae bacterium]|nr:MAG: 3-dehydroquinate synthase [Phycisphaeraceae bacterium]